MLHIWRHKIMTVEPIRNRTKLKQIYQYLYSKDPKYGLLFKFGINTGLRISDMLPLKVRDVYNKNGEFHEYLLIKEKKTGKEKKIKINDMLRKSIDTFMRNQKLSSEDNLFFSSKGPYIGRVQAYRVLKEATGIFGVENFGTHSLRKTWGYWTYKLSKYNIGLIMDTFNHSSANITLRYIGVNQDQKDELYSLVQL